MRRWWFGTAPVGVGVILLLAAGCSADATKISGSDEQGFVNGDGSSQVIEVGQRLAAPEVSGTTLEGEDLSLSEFTGDVVVVNVWGSWCAPCRAEAPILREVYEESKSQGVEFLGLNTRDQDAAALAFEKNFGITYPSLVDTNGELQLAFRNSLPPNAIPSTLVIDRNGQVAARIVGATTYTQLSDLVDEVAAER
jgi:thiol-disulfide isomerase/thioredoxin